MGWKVHNESLYCFSWTAKWELVISERSVFIFFYMENYRVVSFCFLHQLNWDCLLWRRCCQDRKCYLNWFPVIDLVSAVFTRRSYSQILIGLIWAGAAAKTAMAQYEQQMDVWAHCRVTIWHGCVPCQWTAESLWHTKIPNKKITASTPQRFLLWIFMSRVPGKLYYTDWVCSFLFRLWIQRYSLPEQITTALLSTAMGDLVMCVLLETPPITGTHDRVNSQI